MFIDDLKKSILQKAIQGKLVEQNPNDEPASELLKRIKEEKKKLIRDGKIKGEKLLTPITEEEKPFNIPNSWERVKLGEVSNLNIGKTPDRKNADYWMDGEVNWFSISDLEDCQIVSETKEKVSKIAIDDCFKSGVSLAGTLIMSFKLTIGKTSILGCDAVFNEAIVSILPIINDGYITRDFLLKILPMLAKDGNTKNAIMGATLNKESLNNLIIPLPPLQEQKRIVDKLDELAPLLDEARPIEEEITGLEKEFPNKLRQSILQYAIQGKLVEQNPNDEPANQLLKRIEEEKNRLIKDGQIKKEKPLPSITTEEIPFSIPSSWEWVRLGNIEEINLGFTYRPEYTEGGVHFLSVKDISGGKIDFSNTQYVSQETYDNAPYGSKPKKGDILFGRVGTLGKPQILDVDEKFCIFVSLGFLRDHSGILNKKYICHWMNSFLFRNQVKFWVKGAAVKNLNTTWLNKFLVPIPPLKEQERIVAKLDELMKLCDELEEQIG